MQTKEKPRIEELTQELEQHFSKKLSPRMREAFARFALENFENFESFEKACELVAAQEITFGRFPVFPRFTDLYREWRRANTGAYTEHKMLPQPRDSGYSGPAHDVGRLKAKVHVAGFLKRSDFRAEAIEEATLKGIDLSEIGILENAATNISTVFPA